ncbi:hypothetical protein HCBAA847_1506 [Helicobacter cinaedi CCUG 18818 = ATCC BAA-847]|uniref:Uncharacterized protein n=1 Tax=Helicobacter cinaedi CCUG 18818 = ATCC BAA-847 TaxID=537971 RepID=A0AAI8MNG7_9HELI|nr:hypothetical protein [Helicobacter cinaedi]EFR47670.1 hypothetical protein HCCG_02219 [Helicobacter cinaedi CCUG 18818 = ATCC BAA-847]BAM32736.1 hypothetical protein HCBAA847_1506 [Helicobacter cinaedi CCUG 18818 = ATCC BAA-847]
MKKAILTLLLFISICMGQTLEDAFAKIAQKTKYRQLVMHSCINIIMNHHQAFLVIKIPTQQKL